ncbi:hypothetical protein [Mycobacterium sp.]|uniref:hypothetical protein n=1 Tax=Mycobacterium sp. TaxID=1785 RepID=UPI003BAB355E
MRTRFATLAEQLGSPNFAVRHAGAYAMASLADDWHRFGNDDERQVCADLQCPQLRQPRPPTEIVPGLQELPNDKPAEDLEVRKTIVTLLDALPPLHRTHFTYADLSNARFEHAQHNDGTNWANGVIPQDVVPAD